MVGEEGGLEAEQVDGRDSTDSGASHALNEITPVALRESLMIAAPTDTPIHVPESIPVDNSTTVVATAPAPAPVPVTPAKSLWSRIGAYGAILGYLAVQLAATPPPPDKSVIAWGSWILAFGMAAYHVITQHSSDKAVTAVTGA